MFRRDISENHEKSSTAQLLSFIFIVALIAVVVRLGAPGLQPEQPHDAASVAAMPYTLAGQGETWRLTVRVETADEELSLIHIYRPWPLSQRGLHRASPCRPWGSASGRAGPESYPNGPPGPVSYTHL